MGCLYRVPKNHRWRLFFSNCLFDIERQTDDSKTEIVGGQTLEGQIATFIENLKLSYNEVVNMPYMRVLLMNKDKMRVANGKKVKVTSGKEMMKRRNG